MPERTMPHVDVLSEASARDPEVVLIERLPSEAPADDHDVEPLAERAEGEDVFFDEIHALPGN